MEVINSLNCESTISVTGTVRERTSKNPKIPTGEIEVVPEQVEVLGRCIYNELPFEINRSREADENTRLKYRLPGPAQPGREAAKSCCAARSSAESAQEHDRARLSGDHHPHPHHAPPPRARGIIWCPPGMHPGKFYALPQAPQQFKQLLMTSGFDRYFQIAPCFRDEDARADRSPGEFYQLDMEMAFASQEDVFAVLEDVLPPIFAKYGKYDTASKAPFTRIAYNEAMEKYGSDKPDLRIHLVVDDVSAKCRAWASSPSKATWSRPWSARISTSPASLWIPCARTSKPPRKTRPTGSRWATTAPLPAALASSPS